MCVRAVRVQRSCTTGAQLALLSHLVRMYSAPRVHHFPQKCVAMRKHFCNPQHFGTEMHWSVLLALVLRMYSAPRLQNLPQLCISAWKNCCNVNFSSTPTHCSSKNCIRVVFIFRKIGDCSNFPAQQCVITATHRSCCDTRIDGRRPPKLRTIAGQVTCVRVRRAKVKVQHAGRSSQCSAKF